MKVTGSARVAAPLSRVWDALQDPAVLARTIPGCHSLEATGSDTYKMTISAGVASIRGMYVGEVELAEPDPPRSFVLRAKGQGAPGTVDATVLVRLSEGEGDGGTRVDYDADATVGGMIGGVGQRMLGGVAKKTAGEFFAAVERALTEPVAAGEAAPGVPAPAEVGQVFAAPERRRVAVEGASAAFVLGGAVALAGVALGYVLGRRRS
ncbi:carbon monoxide dehydrogenase subunit G [Actinomadura barringtoniae]|uniref:Carbon monoxide dehydrogenase subunit G n=1 Tax=Actinomadura barringtoniae TaxID=1427535 RepID=A0A939PH46_9ACTN|nr:carbon monoxide dehydrogenase subunit G [Actinomadura barringtoniae]MBO2452390.1 carbon monoxide dehydrogenase subunit G [Actinomadura barringtoniae]